MSQPAPPPVRKQADAGLTPAHAQPDPDGQQAALRQHHRERLVHLFRHAGNSAGTRYLLALMARYRGVQLP